MPEAVHFDAGCRGMLLNGAELARRLGIDQRAIYRMKAAGQQFGDSPWVGRYTTEEKFRAWSALHPGFDIEGWRIRYPSHIADQVRAFGPSWRPRKRRARPRRLRFRREAEEIFG